MSASQRSAWPDSVRGSCVVLVVLLHAALFSADHGTTPAALEYVGDATTPFRMPVLMALSGFFVPAALRHGTRRFVGRRLRHVLWPLVVWSIVITAFDLAKAALTGDVGAVRDLAMHGPFGTWFLAYLLAFSGIALATRRVPPLVVATLSWSTAVTVPDDPDGRVDRFFVLLAFHMIGVAAGRRVDLVTQALSSVPLVLLSATALVGTAAASTTVEGGTAHYSPWVAVPAAASLVAVAWLARAAETTPVSRALARVGRRSIVYYLPHYLGVTVGVVVAGRLGWDGWSLVLTGATGGLAVGAGLHVLTTLVPTTNVLFAWPSRMTRERRAEAPVGPRQISFE